VVVCVPVSDIVALFCAVAVGCLQPVMLFFFFFGKEAVTKE
jgi:hypothetical protein